MRKGIVKLENAAIEREAWDHCIRTGDPFLPDAFSWMLDEVSPGWEGLVLYGEEGSYRAVMPVPVVYSRGFSFVRQAPFSFLLGVSANRTVTQKERSQLLQHMFTSYRFISAYSLYAEVQPERQASLSVVERSNFCVDLKRPYAEIQRNYTKNRKRDLQKACKNNVLIKEAFSLDEFYTLFRQYTQRKIYNFTDEVVEKSKTVFLLYRGQQMLRIQNAYLGGDCVGSAVFLVSDRGLYYLMASYSDKAHALGVSTALIDSILKEYSGTVNFLSFNGSNEAGLSRFYSGFGAEPFSFFMLRQLRLPYLLRKVYEWRTGILKAVFRRKKTHP